jgi:TRAP-type mannitol/chloroaromatic compound transport system permease small subunit
MADDVDLSSIEGSAAAPQPFDPIRLVLDGLAAIGTVWTFALMVLICADVIGRSFLNMPITGVAEIAAHSVVGIVFLQIGATIYQRRMTRADFLIDGILARSPALGRGIEALFLLLGAACMAFIAWASWPGTLNAFNAREFFGVQGLFTVPTWPFRALIVLGGVAGTVAHLALFVIEIGRLRGAGKA